jgi:medium-chain acyl-[acyl-carrier-protein] hydrolase
MTNSAGKLWFPYAKPRLGSKLRLFCLPYAGGSAVIYRKWADLLPPFVEVFAVEIPGRGGRMREKPYTSIQALVEALENGITDYLEPPFAFFGHSMGAVIGFELAHKLLSARGLQPVHLFFSGRMAPQIVIKERPTYNLPHAEFIEELRRLQGTPAELLDNPELLELLEPILRADFQAIETYRYHPKPPLPCPFTVLGGHADKDITREHLEAWRQHTSGSFSLHMFPGHHFFLHDQMGMVLQTVSKALSRTASAESRDDRRL